MSTQGNIEKLKMAVKAARMYYECDENQQQIAKELNISRPQVSRLLQLAREEGIVEIKINSPFNNTSELESTICQHFGIKKVIVVPMSTQGSDEIKENLARVTASYLDSILTDKQVIGIPWGLTLSYVAKYLKERTLHHSTVVQLKGGVGKISGYVDTYNPIITFALKLKATPCFLPVPGVIDNIQIKEILLQDEKIKEILELANQADVAIYPIGLPGPDSVLVRAGYFTKDEMLSIRERGAVGDICSRYFNMKGEIFDPKLNDRTIGIELDKLQYKKYAIAIAGGKDHAPGILGALRGKYMNVLVTDETAAKEVLRLAKISV